MTFERACHLSWVNDEQPSVLRAGVVDDLQVALHGVRPVEQERRQRVGDTAGRRGLARRAGAGRIEVEAPARAAGILRLQQQVAIVAPLATDLDRVSVQQPGQVAVEFHVFSDRSHGWLAENPSSGSRVAADVDLRKPAREVVEVGARNADVRARRQPLRCRRRDVVVVVQPAANVENGLGAEHARPRAGAAVAGVGARAGEAAVGRAAVLPEEPGIEDHGPHEAETVRDLVLGAQPCS